MNYKKFKKFILFNTVAIATPLLSASCVKQDNKETGTYFSSWVKNLDELHGENQLTKSSIFKYEKNNDQKSLENYNLLTKKSNDFTVQNINKEIIHIAKVKENFNKWAKDTKFANIEELETLSMEQRIQKYLEDNTYTEAKLKKLYRDSFDTSLTYLINKFVPNNYFNYDVYNYIKYILDAKSTNDLIDNDMDNIFRIYNDSNVKTMIEIPVKIINFNRDNTWSELNTAYNEGSVFWDQTDYKNANIKEVIKYRNIDIDPINLNKPIYKDYNSDINLTDDQMKEEISKVYNKIKKSSSQDQHLKYMQELAQKIGKVSPNYIRQNITNPYYEYHLNKLIETMSGVKGYQISFYGTKVRIYFDHELSEEEISKIKQWDFYDDYKHDYVKESDGYKYLEEINKVTQNNLKTRDLLIFNNFQELKDYVFGTRIFADFRLNNQNDQRYEYLNLLDWDDESFLRNKRDLSWDKHKDFIDWYRNVYEKQELNSRIVFESDIRETGKNWNNNSSLYKNFDISEEYQNVYPSLTVAKFVPERVTSNFTLLPLNWEEYIHIDYIDTTDVKSFIFIGENIIFGEWGQGSRFSILPEKNYLSKQSKNFTSLKKNNYELTYNLDWKVVSYSLIPFDLDNKYSEWNRNYQTLNKYLNDKLQSNDLEIARIGIDQLSTR